MAGEASRFVITGGRVSAREWYETHTHVLWAVAARSNMIDFIMHKLTADPTSIVSSPWVSQSTLRTINRIPVAEGVEVEDLLIDYLNEVSCERSDKDRHLPVPPPVRTADKPALRGRHHKSAPHRCDV